MMLIKITIEKLHCLLDLIKLKFAYTVYLAVAVAALACVIPAALLTLTLSTRGREKEADGVGGRREKAARGAGSVEFGGREKTKN